MTAYAESCAPPATPMVGACSVIDAVPAGTVAFICAAEPTLTVAPAFRLTLEPASAPFAVTVPLRTAVASNVMLPATKVLSPELVVSARIWLPEAALMVLAMTETSPALESALPSTSRFRVSITALEFSVTEVALSVTPPPTSKPATVTAPGAAPVASSVMLPLENVESELLTDSVITRPPDAMVIVGALNATSSDVPDEAPSLPS